MNVDGDIVNCGCDGEVFSDGVIGEEGVGGELDKGDGVMKEIGDTARVTTLTVLAESGVVWERIGWYVFC